MALRCKVGLVLKKTTTMQVFVWTRVRIPRTMGIRTSLEPRYTIIKNYCDLSKSSIGENLMIDSKTLIILQNQENTIMSDKPMVD